MTSFVSEFGILGPFVFGAVALFALINILRLRRGLQQEGDAGLNTPMGLASTLDGRQSTSKARGALSPKLALVMSIALFLASGLLFVVSLMDNLS